MSFLEGSCIASMTLKNNTEHAVTLTQGSVYQMAFMMPPSPGSGGLPLPVPLNLTVQPGDSAPFSVYAQQGSDFPGDDTGTINCSFAGGGTATIQWKGVGVNTNDSPMSVLGWVVVPGTAPVQAATGGVANTGDNVALLNWVANEADSFLKGDAVIPVTAAGAVAAIASDTMMELAMEASEALLAAAALYEVDLMVSGAQDGVQLTGAQTITLAVA